MKPIKLLAYLILPLMAFGLQSCGDENEDEPTVKEVFTAWIATPVNGVPGSVIFEETSAAQLATIIPCEISRETKEQTVFSGGTNEIEYELTLYKWKSADLSIVTTVKKDYEVYSADCTTYSFTSGEYSFDVDGATRILLVKEDGIYFLNPYTHEEINQILPLENYKRTYQTLSDKPLRTYQENESSAYNKPFTLVKLAEDHFYIENADYTFEGYITAKGVEFSQIKPEEKEIGLLYR